MTYGIGYFIVEAAAIVTAGSAVGAWNYLRKMHEAVEENRERSTRNREMLTGATPDRKGVIPRMREIERQVLHSDGGTEEVED